MSDATRDRDLEKSRATDQLRRHGVAVAEMPGEAVTDGESLEDQSTLSATQMLEWLRRSPEWATSKR